MCKTDCRREVVHKKGRTLATASVVSRCLASWVKAGSVPYEQGQGKQTWVHTCRVSCCTPLCIYNPTVKVGCANHPLRSIRRLSSWSSPCLGLN